MDPTHLLKLNESMFCNQATAFKKMSLDGYTFSAFFLFSVSGVGKNGQGSSE